MGHGYRLATICVILIAFADATNAQEKVELRSPAQIIEFFKSKGYWGPEKRDQTLEVPRAYYARTVRSFDRIIRKFPTDVKKELFYRSALPLILLTNEAIVADRQRFLRLAKKRSAGEALLPEEKAWLIDLAARYKVVDKGTTDLGDKALNEVAGRVDIVPPSLALGQAAYESAYGSSRFALHGNAYFGLWTWGKKGIRPKQQRGGKGDYKVAAYDTPLKSVEAYIHNLNTHRTYANLRSVRARLRRDGKRLTGSELANTLTGYSERGGAYIKTLKGIMRFNDLEIADNAVLRDEPAVFLIEIE